MQDWPHSDPVNNIKSQIIGTIYKFLAHSNDSSQHYESTYIAWITATHLRVPDCCVIPARNDNKLWLELKNTIRRIEPIEMKCLAWRAGRPSQQWPALDMTQQTFNVNAEPTNSISFPYPGDAELLFCTMSSTVMLPFYHAIWFELCSLVKAQAKIF